MMLVTAHSNTHNTGHNTITVASFAGWIFIDDVSGARSAAMLNPKTLSVHYKLLKTPAPVEYINNTTLNKVKTEIQYLTHV